MKTDFLAAITTLTSEKNLPEDVVFEAVESALAAAYKRDHNFLGQVHVTIDRTDSEMRVWSEREIVEIEEDIADEDLQVDLETAREHDANLQIGDTLTIEHEISPAAGRIAAQTAKQVVLQRLREAEREAVFEEYTGQEGDAVSGIIQRVEPRQVILDLGRTEAILPAAEQVRMEHYRTGQRLLVHVVEVLRNNKGPQVVVSRTHKALIQRIFELEVPEVFKGLVEIKAIAREPGHRTKVAVHSRQEGLDPVGACVGIRSVRIQNIVNELQGERIDVIQWDPDPRKFVAHALSPAQVSAARIDPKTNTAEIAVPDQQLSLAIGKEGQNARLAAKLTRLRIDIKLQSVAEKMLEQNIGPFAEQPELPSVEIEEPTATPTAIEETAPDTEQEPAVAVQDAAPQTDRRDAQPGTKDDSKSEAEEPELATAFAAVEVQPQTSDAGRIRFAEDVLRRPAEEPEPKSKRRRRQRYVETDEGLEDDPYAEYQDQEDL
jgi:N utilization substance protein A